MRELTGRAVIALTGGPCGGKSALLEGLRHDPAFAGRFVSLNQDWFPFHGIPPRDPLFQRLVVFSQAAMEEAVHDALGNGDSRPLLTHRGTLDPLAYWLLQGWGEREFFAFTGTTRGEHYRRYAAVVHLVTAADGAQEHYARYPDNPRTETPEEAICLDRLLGQIWGSHPGYLQISNSGRQWEDKAREAKAFLLDLCLSEC